MQAVLTLVVVLGAVAMAVLVPTETTIAITTAVLAALVVDLLRHRGPR
ncbi:hypothetical protein [Geodermatophilus sp. DSM 45219]|nr:hypothetical protein [Geodermatophilus sp. DSM 45219]